MINITANSGKVTYNVQEYMLDYETDVADLPEMECTSGSAAYVIETGDLYLKNSRGEWVKQ